MCAGCTIQCAALILRIAVLILLILQLAFGVCLTIAGYFVISETAPTSPKSLNNQTAVEVSISLFSYARNISSFTKSSIAKACIILMCSGVLLSAFGIVGISSIMSKKPKFLLIFLAVMIASSSASMAVTSALYSYQETTAKAIIDVMQWSLITQYDGSLNSTNKWSRLWDLGQVTFECCGIENYTDFKMSQKFNRAAISAFTRLPNTTMGSNVFVPLSCCKIADGYSMDIIKTVKTGTISEKGVFQLLDSDCPFNPTVNNSNIARGCKTALDDALARFSSLFYATSTTSFTVQISIQLGIIVIIYAAIS